MDEVKTSILDAIEKMHKLLINKEDITQEEIKTDIAIANATSNLAKVYISTIALENKIESSLYKNQFVLKEM